MRSGGAPVRAEGDGCGFSIRSGNARSGSRGKASIGSPPAAASVAWNSVTKMDCTKSVLVANHIEYGLAAAHRQALGGFAAAVHFLRRPGERRAVVDTQRGADAGQVIGPQLRRHRAQGVAGKSGARPVNAPGQQAA